MQRQERKPIIIGSLPRRRRPLGNVLREEVVNSASSLCAVALVKLGPLLAKVKEFLRQGRFCVPCLWFVFVLFLAEAKKKPPL